MIADATLHDESPSVHGSMSGSHLIIEASAAGPHA
jgi:hypothetical protein